MSKYNNSFDITGSLDLTSLVWGNTTVTGSTSIGWTSSDINTNYDRQYIMDVLKNDPELLSEVVYELRKNKLKKINDSN